MIFLKEVSHWAVRLSAILNKSTVELLITEYQQSIRKPLTNFCFTHKTSRIYSRAQLGSMDINYDTVKARQLLAPMIMLARPSDPTHLGETLQKISTARSQGLDNGHQLSEFVLVSVVSCSFRYPNELRLQNSTFQQCVKVYKYDHPTTWRFVSEHNGPSNAEEVVLRIQGVLSLKDLPPLANKPK